MTLIHSTSDAVRVGWVPTYIATNLSSDETFRGRLLYDGPNPEGEMKTFQLAQYHLEETSIEAPASVQKPASEVRVSFEKVYKMQVQLLPNELKTAYPIFFGEIGRSLAREISLLNTSLPLIAATADSQILLTKYTTTNTPNLSSKTAVQDGVFIIRANASADPAQVKSTDYGLSPKRLMQAITIAKSRDARYQRGPGTNAIGTAGGTPVYGFGRPYVVCTDFDLMDLQMWQFGMENNPDLMTQYAHIIPGLANAFSVARSPMDSGRYDLDGKARTPMRSATYYQDFEILTMPPTKEGVYGPETLLYGAPGVQKINLTGSSGTGKIDIIYRIVIGHNMHISRWNNFRTQPILAGSGATGNRSVEYYDSALTAGVHRNDGKGLVMLEVRRPYNYDPDTGSIFPTITGTGLTPHMHTFNKENTSMAEAMEKSSSTRSMGRNNLAIKVEHDSCKAFVTIDNRDPQMIDLNEIPTLQELPNADGTGTVITGGQFRKMTH